MITSLLALAAVQAPLPDHFQPMAFLIGHCWQAEMGQGQVDTHCFEPVYGGRFIRDRHVVTGGRTPYEGETIYAWNAAANRVQYTYWASSGGVSRGSLVARDGVLDFGEDVHRRANGTELRIATTWQPRDNGYEVRWTSSEQAMNRTMRYVRADAAPVRIAEQANADGTRTLSHELVVPAPIDQVYRALATVEGWRSWAVPHAWDVPGEPDLIETSYSPDARLGNPANIRQRFLARIPERLILFKTVQFPPSFPDAEAFARTTALFELEPIGSGTRVRLTGSGYPSGPAGERVLGFFREGNRVSLEQLRARFVTGPIDWAARQARR